MLIKVSTRAMLGYLRSLLHNLTVYNCYSRLQSEFCQLLLSQGKDHSNSVDCCTLLFINIYTKINVKSSYQNTHDCFKRNKVIYFY